MRLPDFIDFCLNKACYWAIWHYTDKVAAHARSKAIVGFYRKFPRPHEITKENAESWLMKLHEHMNKFDDKYRESWEKK